METIGRLQYNFRKPGLNARAWHLFEQGFGGILKMIYEALPRSKISEYSEAFIIRVFQQCCL